VHEDRAAQPPSAERYAESVAGCPVLLDEHLAAKLSHSCVEGTNRRVGEAVGMIELGGTRPTRGDRATAKRSAEASTGKGYLARSNSTQAFFRRARLPAAGTLQAPVVAPPRG
jgi:hypothetical protein